MKLVLLPPVLLAVAGASTAQDVFMNFDQGCKVGYFGVANPGPGLYPVNTNLPGSPFAPGRWGEALRGLDGPPQTTRDQRRVMSGLGWIPGSFSLSLWITERFDVRGTTAYPITSTLVDGAVRLYLSPQTNPDVSPLILTIYGTSPSTLTLHPDLAPLAQGRWLHLALVFDATAGTLTTYVDGTAEPTISGIQVQSTPVAGQVSFGTSPNLACYHDIDEVYIAAGRVMTASEVQRRSRGAAAGTFTRGSLCSMQLSTTGGTPSAGANLTVQVLPPPGRGSLNMVLGVGDSLCQIAGLPLPYDLGAIQPQLSGCFLWSNLNLLQLAVSTSPGMPLTMPLVVPINPAFVTLSLQALAVDPSTGDLLGSSATVLAIGNQ